MRHVKYLFKKYFSFNLKFKNFKLFFSVFFFLTFFDILLCSYGTCYKYSSFFDMFFLVLVTPVFEEIFFRGILISALLNFKDFFPMMRTRIKTCYVILFQAIFFAVLHRRCQLILFFELFITAFLYGYVYVKEDYNLFPTILLHIINNFFVVFLYPFL